MRHFEKFFRPRSDNVVTTAHSTRKCRGLPRITWCMMLVTGTCLSHSPRGWSREPVPAKLVVLTFDDSVKSHFTVVRPILKKYGFGATFFVTEGFDFTTNKHDYMTWDEIRQLHQDGFEVGNHTRDHLGIHEKNVEKLAEQLEGIAQRCREHQIPVPISFAYPGNALTPKALPILRDHGIRFARRGGAPEFPYESGRGVAYEPGLDDPLLIPSAGDARPAWELDDFVTAVNQARFGRIAVLQFHGVPDRAHAWVHTDPEKFDAYMHYLATHGFRVIAMRDLEKYVDATIHPRDPWGPITDRQTRLAAGKTLDNFRQPLETELDDWLGNMREHDFTLTEMSAATGLSEEVLQPRVERVKLSKPRQVGDRLHVLPYPGGRHPRIGFQEGAIRPQRETKISVFTPWAEGGYVVVDIPEAIWVEHDGKPELLYLAHTHVPTRWTRKEIELERLEWRREADGTLISNRMLPDRISFGARVVPGKDGVEMELWLTNGTSQPLTGLRVQNCVMLKGARGFDSMSNDNKSIATPFVACRNESGDKWIITAWTPCHRAWTNPPCPCMHSDPQFPETAPGATSRLRGWLSFYQGNELGKELDRIRREWLEKRG